MQSYINDLSEQNGVLVLTVEELEKEANKRVSHLEEKLVKVTSSLKVSYHPSHLLINILNVSIARLILSNELDKFAKYLQYSLVMKK